MRKPGRMFFVAGVVVAAIAITAAFLYFPPVDESDARGAIGAVEKHHEKQITASDVVLGDEEQRKEEAGLYGSLLADSEQLESMSAELGMFAQSLGSASFDPQSLGSFNQTLDSAFSSAANESLGLVSQLRGRAELESFSANLQSMQRAFENRKDLGLRELESFEQMTASLARALEAKNALEAKSMVESNARLEGFSRQFENRQALESRAMNLDSSAVGSMVQDLEARQQLGMRILESRMLESKVSQLEAKVLEQKTLLEARNHLESLGKQASLGRQATLESRQQLYGLSAQLASRAAALESRALRNMQARYEMRVLESRMVRNMAMMEAFASQHLEGRSNLESRELKNLTAALGNLSAELRNREPMLAQRFMVGARSELGAISQHLESKEQLGSRQFAGMENRQQLENRGLQNLESFSSHLQNLTASLESKALANRESSMLGIQAEQLRSRTAALQSRAAM